MRRANRFHAKSVSATGPSFFGGPITHILDAKTALVLRKLWQHLAARGKWMIPGMRPVFLWFEVKRAANHIFRSSPCATCCNRVDHAINNIRRVGFLATRRTSELGGKCERRREVGYPCRSGNTSSRKRSRIDGEPGPRRTPRKALRRACGRFVFTLGNSPRRYKVYPVL